MLDISDLKQKEVTELRALAERFNINGRGRIKKEELVFAILKAQAEKKLVELTSYVTTLCANYKCYGEFLPRRPRS